MTDRIDRILSRIPAPALDHSLDQLEPDVWALIEGRRRSARPWDSTIRFQLAAAALALIIGLAIGWVNNGARQLPSDESMLYATYIQTGPMARLESGL